MASAGSTVWRRGRRWRRVHLCRRRRACSHASSSKQEAKTKMLIDSHCHLDFPDFAEERDEIVARAKRAGVGRMVTISTRISRFDQIREIAEAYEEVYCTVGVHPHQAAEEQAITSVGQLVEMAAHPKVVGMGETGLYNFSDTSPRDIQESCFRIHARACLEPDLPIVVHTRDAD